MNWLHLLSHAQLAHVQWATEHGYRCWVELGLHFKNGSVFTTLNDVICQKVR